MGLFLLQGCHRPSQGKALVDIPDETPLLGKHRERQRAWLHGQMSKTDNSQIHHLIIPIFSAWRTQVFSSLKDARKRWKKEEEEEKEKTQEAPNRMNLKVKASLGLSSPRQKWNSLQFFFSRNKESIKEGVLSSQQRVTSISNSKFNTRSSRRGSVVNESD